MYLEACTQFWGFPNLRKHWQYNFYVVLLIHFLAAVIYTSQAELPFNDNFRGLPENGIAYSINCMFGFFIAVPICSLIALYSRDKMCFALSVFWLGYISIICALIITDALGWLSIKIGIWPNNNYILPAGFFAAIEISMCCLALYMIIKCSIMRWKYIRSRQMQREVHRRMTKEVFEPRDDISDV